MKHGEFDEQIAKEFMQMLKEGPTIKDINDNYPGVDNFVRVMSAQIITHFIIPYLEDNISVPDLIEAVRRYMMACVATGMNLSRSDQATSYVKNLYNKPAFGEGQGE
ncbi:MAG: hypothetical protein K9L17_13965 [Clostridiales bacterium]|nr:hypothetical protein [Clostridiales bacterium]MCF8023779.1 hypothetical protein [Clostridiales bacterium]